jgi:trans-2,3-dihydro-3-hydroxyanthranilate isomerase
MKRRYVTLDVFTDRRFAGNPLAVVLEADGLGTETMQEVANEFNLPETVFVLPAEDKKHRARCRIFTPKRELPFAGHPTVGTAVLLASLDTAKGEKPGEFVLEEKIGLIRCRVKADAGGGEASFALPMMPSEVTAPPPNETLAAALGLDVTDIGAGGFALAPSFPGLFVFSRETAEKGNDFHARMFAPAMGIMEDPATGSAVAAFAGLLGRFGGYGDGDHAVAIEQGYEMGRPSLIRLGMTRVAGQFTAVTVGGNAVIVAEGAIEA